MELVVGKQYIINILPFKNDRDDELLCNHIFFHNRIVTYLGRDYTCTLGESHIFLSGIPLYENIKTSLDHAVFNEFTCICISYVNPCLHYYPDIDHSPDIWKFHILRNRFEIVREL